MKAMLLAAGKGERMRPLTLTTPKALLTAAGKPLIDWHLERLVDAGIREFAINVSWLGEEIERHCGTGERYGGRIVYSREPDAPLETAGGIVQALPLLGNEPFLVVNADIWTDFNFASLIDSTDAGTPEAGGASLILVDNPEHNHAGDFSLDGPTITERSASTLTFAGIGLYHPQFFADCVPGKRPLLPLFHRAMAAGRLTGTHYRGHWTDVGTPGRLRALEERLRGGSLASGNAGTIETL